MNVEVGTGRVVVLATIFVDWMLEVNVWPGKTDDLMIQDVYVSISVVFEAAAVLMEEVRREVKMVLVD